MILINIKVGILPPSTKMGSRRPYVKGARIIKPIRHLDISKTIRDTPLSKAIFADVGTKAKKNDDSNTIPIAFHCLLSNLIIIILVIGLTTSKVEIEVCIIVCCLRPLCLNSTLNQLQLYF